MTAVAAKDDASGIQGYMALGESRTSLNLVNGTLENPRDLYFTVDDIASQRLGDDEVEIEAKAVLLK